MKFSPADLKNVDYKKLFINHFEKFIFVIVILVALKFVLGTTWKPYDKTPQELLDTVAEKEEEFKSSDWPETDKEKYETNENVVEEAKEVFTPVNVAKYESNEGYYEPLIKLSKKYEEPDWLPPKNLIATAGKGPIFQKDPNKPASTSEEEEEFEIVEEEEVDLNRNPFEPRSKLPVGNNQKAKKKGLPPGSKIKLGGGGDGGGFLSGGDSDNNDDDEKKKKRKLRKKRDAYARGFHYAIIRGIIPLKEQLREIADSRGVPTAAGFDYSIYYDSVVERQEAIADSSDWSDWEQIDPDIYKKIYMESQGELDEIVDDQYIHPYLTMPLSARAMGFWGREITHPVLKEYRLNSLEMRIVESLEEMKREGSIGQDEDEELKDKLPEKAWDEDGGSSSKTLYADVSSASNKMDELIQKIQEEDEFKNTTKEEIIKIVQEKANADGSIMLYRFFDFSVLPGRQYRYRVKLVCKNPNYGFSPSMLAHPDVADGKTRETKWSEVTDPVQIEPDSTYALSRISPPRGTSSSRADFEYYQWLDSSGTIIHKQLSIEPGEFLGGQIKTRVLRPGSNTYNEEDINLDNYDVVVNLMPPPEFSRNDHPDLKSSVDLRKQTVLQPEALIANEFGSLVTLKPDSGVNDKTSTKKEYDMQQQAYRNVIRIYEDDENYTDNPDEADEDKKNNK